MATALKIFVPIFGLVVLGVLATVVYGAVYPQRIVDVIQPGSVFEWENFNPFSREPGWLGLSPLIWTSLLVVPVVVLLPALIYFYEKKRITPITRGFFAAIRACVLIVLYVLIAGPALVDSETYVEGSKVAVLIDDSLSMGAESREFPIFNVLDDRESDDIQRTRTALTELGVALEDPPRQGFVTLTEDELKVRNFVRQVVRDRAARLKARLEDMHGSDFHIRDWQQLRREVQELAIEADRVQSELSAQNARDEPDRGEVRRLQSELESLFSSIEQKEASFATLLGGEPTDDEVRRKRAIVENLLETVHPEGPRRWDIACELVASGNSLSVPPGRDAGLIDIIRARAEEIRAKGRDAEEEDDNGRASMLRFFVFSTMFGREQATDEAILEVSPEELDYRAPRGRLTELDQALSEVRRYYTEEDDLASIVVLSDGRDTSPSESREAPGPRRREGGVEVATVAVGNPKPVKVLELLSVSADREILKGDYLDFKLKIRADEAYRADPAEGKAGTEVKIILCEDSVNNPVPFEELNGQPVRNPDDAVIELGPEELAEVRIRFKPEVTGRHVYFLKLNEDRLPDEDTYRNNVKEHYVDIIDRKIKLLYIEQRARYQWRYLNEALKRDKNLEYQGFLLEGDDNWSQPVSLNPGDDDQEVRPLRAPFYDAETGRVIRDKQDFFDLNYDVIILGDIDPEGTNFRREYWDWIEEWVSRQRGGLILMAGSGHNPHDYRNIESARVLYPVELDFPPGYESMVNTQIKKYWRLTPAGRAHEVHRLSSNSARNDELWGRVVDGNFRSGMLHGAYWYQPTGGIKPAPAVALSRVAREGPVTGEGDVLTATMPYGNGMTFYVGSDDTWYWRQFVGDFYFYRFWQNSIRFVASRRLAGKQQRVDVYTDRNRYQVGEDVKVYVELLGDIYGEVVQNQRKELQELPRSGDEDEVRKIIVEMQARSGGRLTSERLVLSEVSWSPNLFEGTVEANEPGQFDVWVRGYEESRKEPHRYAVIAPVAELRDLTLDFDGMRRRATQLPPGHAELDYQVGKRVYEMTDMGQAAIEIRERENEVKGVTALLWDRREDPFTLRSLLLAVLLLLLAGEWFTRKLVRMV